MQGSEFDEAEFFRAIAASGCVGPVPTRTPEEARGRGRYVLEALRKEEG